MLDRRVAGTVGRFVAGGGHEPGDPPPVDLIGCCADAARAIGEYTGLEPDAGLPSPEWVGRGEWIDLNVSALDPVLVDPLAAAGALRPVVVALASAEAGIVTGLLSQRVLGQVEPGLLRGPEHETRMVLVGPNLRGAAAELAVDPADLVRWVAVHDMTHAVPFTAVPWLRAELERRLRAVLDALELRLDARALLRLPDLGDLRGLVDLVRSGEVMAAVAGPEVQGQLDGVQALMGLVEGHAEHVMDEVGRELVADLDGLRRALDGRRRERSVVETVLYRLLGVDAKLRQYTLGKAFCDALVASAGPDALRRAWDSPRAAPTLVELGDPARWLARVG